MYDSKYMVFVVCACVKWYAVCCVYYVFGVSWDARMSLVSRAKGGCMLGVLHSVWGVRRAVCVQMHCVVFCICSQHRAAWALLR